MRHALRSLHRRQAGLTLVELMVSITLGLMILSGVLTVFFNTSAARNEVERTSRQIENGRHAVQLLSTDLRLAGFYGEFNPSSVAAPASLPGDPCSLAAADWQQWLPFHVLGFDNVGFASPSCALPGLKPGTDVVMLRRARTCFAGVGGCDPAAAGLPYLQVSLCASEVTPIKVGVEGGAAFDLKSKDCVGTAEKRQYYTHIYFVSTDNGVGGAVPTLMRLELTGSGWNVVPLVEGIEEFQAEYGLDSDGDGAPDAYVANPSDFPKGACTGACPTNNWLNVVTVRFHVLARNLDASPGYVDAKTYELGKDDSGNPVSVTPGGAYRRHVYGSLVRIVNAAGRRETP
ncbi:MAG TPA: PilW family protein [Burkholderiales bacterium]|nr:PilW family protein [Burkholderiales bacterium]